MSSHPVQKMQVSERALYTCQIWQLGARSVEATER